MWEAVSGKHITVSGAQKLPLGRICGINGEEVKAESRITRNSKFAHFTRC
jgi:hypothetical protein